MPLRKQVRKFGLQFMLRNVVVILSHGIIAAALWYLLPQFTSLIFFGAFINTFISLILVERYGFKTFECPTCRRVLPKRCILDGDDEIICFVCETCDVEWDTGLRTPDN